MKKQPNRAGVPPEDLRPATYTPYIEPGAISVDELQKLLAALKRSGAEAVRLGGDSVFIWGGPDRPNDPSGGLAQEVSKAAAVRPARLCSAETTCRSHHRPVLALARKLDERYRGALLPMRLHIAVAGCESACSEPGVKDIGITAYPDGFLMELGGFARQTPSLATNAGMAKDEATALEAVGRVIAFLAKQGKKTRLGQQIKKMGLDHFKAETGLDKLLVQRTGYIVE